MAPMAALAGARHFTYVYEATTSAPGSVETENWATWSRTSDGGRSNSFDFRHELEFGVTRRLQASIYLADWSYLDERGRSGFRYSDTAVEVIYNLTNPILDPVGISIYQELRAGDRLCELESKFIAQKNIGRWILAYNATVEAVWDGKDWGERKGEIQNSLGVSYQVSTRFSVGLEFLHEFVLPQWNDHEKIRNVFVGPNVAYRRGSWFVTVTGLAQASSTPDEPEIQLRTIFGTSL